VLDVETELQIPILQEALSPAARDHSLCVSIAGNEASKYQGLTQSDYILFCKKTAITTITNYINGVIVQLVLSTHNSLYMCVASLKCCKHKDICQRKAIMTCIDGSCNFLDRDYLNKQRETLHTRRCV